MSSNYTRANLPTYAELAQELVNLIEHSVSNIDTPGNRFVNCYTYGTDAFRKTPAAMGVYTVAIQMRAALKKERVVVEGKR